ncbi:MAG: YgiQ family radical SAM protein [Spirochaetales bacterium]|nr:YgiQ family radical SAM protein [Spirochaetales bacterium]
MSFMPTTLAEMAARHTECLDFVIVSGDSYVDHPSFGGALIGRWLESLGYTVGMLARPDPSDVAAFRALGKPRLAFLVAGGALDSMVCSYTANRRRRAEDEYAPGGDPCLCRSADGSLHAYLVNGKATNARPDRAVIAYCGRCREAYKGVPVIAGGLEASLRRLSHYDYLSDTVRKPIILDAKADLVIYGMAERAIAEVAQRLAANASAGVSTENASFDASMLRGIRGTVWRSSREGDVPVTALRLPDHATAAVDAGAFAESFAVQYRNTDPGSALPLCELAAGQFVVQEPPQAPLSREELDAVYSLRFERVWHPAYDAYGGVPAFAEVKFSIASSRGCYGACAFCALAFHQGRIVTSRSKDSIVAEARELTTLRGFKGYIHDIGGPTANFRGPACKKQAAGSACVTRRCLTPELCPSLVVSHRDYLDVLRAVRSLPGIKKAFVRSGIRFDYVMADKDDAFLRELALYHVSGQLKVAPEHVSARVLALMGKPRHEVYDGFARAWAKTNRELGLKQYLVPYFIASHPGSELVDAIELAEYLRDSGFVPDQVQDFYPTPGTLATAMYHSGLDPLSMQPVYVARGAKERAMQRALLQYSKPENRELVLEALRFAGRTDLIGRGPRCLVS